MEEKIVSYKGTDKDMKCRGYQYELGKEYETGKAKACSAGFYGCEYPLDVFGYYPPGTSRYFKCEQSGKIDRDGDDSKIASTKIKLNAEIGIPDLVKAAFEYTKAHTTTEHTDPKMATAGEYGAATAGYRGAATAGYRGAATASYCGAATAGEYGAATSRGRSATGKNGLSVARGSNVMVKGGLGALLVIAEEKSDSYDIKEYKVAVVDGEKIKADTWYRLKDGELAEVTDV